MTKETKMRLAALGFGSAFGYLLAWAGLTDYDAIDDMLALREALFLPMGSAVATASQRREHVTGSVLFGLGWGVACTCPGPVAAQIGRGQVARVFTIAGILLGLAAHARLGARRKAENGARSMGHGVAAGL